MLQHSADKWDPRSEVSPAKRMLKPHCCQKFKVLLPISPPMLLSFAIPQPVPRLFSFPWTLSVYLSLCGANFLMGQRNKAFPGEADQALELAQGTEQNCVTRTAREDDGKKYSHIPSQWLWAVVRSVQGLFLFTPSNMLPLQCKGLTCLTELTLFEGSRAGDAWYLSGGKRSRER